MTLTPSDDLASTLMQPSVPTSQGLVAAGLRPTAGRDNFNLSPFRGWQGGRRGRGDDGVQSKSRRDAEVREQQSWRKGEDECVRAIECEAAVYLPNKLDRISSIIKE